MHKLLKKLTLKIAVISASLVIGFGLSASLAKAETTQCTEIPSVPFTITAQGIYCLKHNVTTGITIGNAITINTNNVTIDMNGFKLGGSAAGADTIAGGIFAQDRKNITIRNGNIRGFYRGIYFAKISGSSGHLIEHIRADGNTFTGMQVEGDNHIIRNNHVINTGSGTQGDSALGMFVSSGSNMLIADNVISGVSETSNATGIFMNFISQAEIHGNSLFEIKDATDTYGISYQSSSEIVIQNNRMISSSGTGTTGAFEKNSSTGIDCIENTIRGYTTGQSGCDYTSGNHIN